MDFSNFRIDPKLDKYLSNAFNLILLIWHNEVLGLEVRNEGKENIKNPGPCFFFIQKRFTISIIYI